MAKYIAGNLAGSISGKVGNIVFSHGRYGAFIRARVKPVITTSAFTESTHNILSACARAWAALPENTKLAWATWAKSNPITDRLGQSQVLAPHAAFNQINGRRLIYPGTLLLLPPVTANPIPIATATVTYDIGAGDCSIDTTPFPLPTDCTQWVEAAVVNSAGTRYVTNLKKTIGYNTNSNVHPFDFQTMIESRFGTLAVGQTVSLWLYHYHAPTGLLSAPIFKSGLVVTT